MQKNKGMSEFRKRYKKIGYDRADEDVNRILRSQQRSQDRRDARCENFVLRRNLDSASHDDKKKLPNNKEKNESKKPSKNKENLKLIMWKAEKERKKLLEKERTKPVFKVYTVHNRVHSPPPFRDLVPLPPLKVSKVKKSLQSLPVTKETTVSTHKRLPLRTITNQQKQENLNSKLKKTVESSLLPKNTISLSRSFASSNHQFEAPKGLIQQPKLDCTETTAMSGISEYLKVFFESLNIH